RAGDLVKGGQLVVEAEERMADAERARPCPRRGHVAAGQEGHLDTDRLQELDAGAVAHVEALPEDVARRPVEVPVGEDAVDVEAEQLDRAQARAQLVAELGCVHALTMSPGRRGCKIARASQLAAFSASATDCSAAWAAPNC